MKNTNGQLIQIRLPETIVVDADANLNALFDFLSGAKAVSAMLSSTNNKYDGDDPVFIVGTALPKIEPLKCKVHATREEAQAEKDEIVAEIERKRNVILKREEAA